jgi:hypothetical protein
MNESWLMVIWEIVILIVVVSIGVVIVCLKLDIDE